MTNRLGRETSPYLLQHAHNPVDWNAWEAAALARARDEDRPILLSIGYSSCHWCHVMERESFEDPSTAALMNRLFVNIKVDREERPDIDQVYMKAVQAMTGRGGWPLTVFLTPDLVPYFGGTYYPPEPRHGMPSFAQVLEAAAEAFAQRRDQVREGGARLVAALVATGDAGGDESREIPSGAVADTVRALEGRYDPVHGGFGPAPKFPQPANFELLLRHHLATGERAALEMTTHTLRRMAAGGLRDHLAGGFHRYSVDGRWLVPHFEKMLYDNALLARSYLDAYRVTGDTDLGDIAVQTLDYLLGDMRSPEGAFFSARDADSEGEEGTFYVWSADEVGHLIGPDDGPLFSRLYDVTEAGNFEGRNILHLPHRIDVVAAAEGIDESELAALARRGREALLAARDRREPPFRDEKMLASWNGLAIRAMAEAGAALARPDYVRAATEAAEFLWATLRPEGRLLHLISAGEASVGAFLEDHAALGNAFLSLHGASLDGRWLEASRSLCDDILTLFWDESAGTVYDTAHDAEALFIRPRDPMDNATPSGPSLAAELLQRAGHVFGDDRYRAAAHRIVAHEAEHLVRFGPAFGRMLSVLDRFEAPPVEVVIGGRRGDEATRELIGAGHAALQRNGVIAGWIEGEPVPTGPLFEGRTLVDAAPTAYVCRGYACLAPSTDPEVVRVDLAPQG